MNQAIAVAKRAADRTTSGGKMTPDQAEKAWLRGNLEMDEMELALLQKTIKTFENAR